MIKASISEISCYKVDSAYLKDSLHYAAALFINDFILSQEH